MTAASVLAWLNGHVMLYWATAARTICLPAPQPPHTCTSSVQLSFKTNRTVCPLAQSQWDARGLTDRQSHVAETRGSLDTWPCLSHTGPREPLTVDVGARCGLPAVTCRRISKYRVKSSQNKVLVCIARTLETRCQSLEQMWQARNVTCLPLLVAMWLCLHVTAGYVSHLWNRYSHYVCNHTDK